MAKRVITGTLIIESHHRNNHNLQQQQQNVALNKLSRKKRTRKCTCDTLSTSASNKKPLPVNKSSNYWHHNTNHDNDDNCGSDNILSNNEKVVPHSKIKISYNVMNNNGSITMGKHGNNDSIKLNTSFNDVSKDRNHNESLIESPKPIYTLRPSIVNGTILRDLKQQSWRLGKPIGKGNFGEIFLASDDIIKPVTNNSAKFVVKIEPHSNGPLFVEIHCLMNTAKNNAGHQQQTEGLNVLNIKNNNNNLYGPPSGIPKYIASGSHRFGNGHYRFLVLPRFDRDLHSLIKNCCVHQKFVLTLAIQVLNVLEKLHNSGYCHNDVKAQNLMISKCKYLKLIKEELPQQQKRCQKSLVISKNFSTGNGLRVKKSKTTTCTIVTSDHMYKNEIYEEKQQTTDSGNSSEREIRDDINGNDDDDNTHFVLRRRIYNNISSTEGDDENDEDEDFYDGVATTNSSSTNIYIYTMLNEKPASRPISLSHQQQQQQQRRIGKGHTIQRIEFSGSNPVRSCRRQKRRNSIYEEMVKSHYLRPTKRISYTEFFSEDVSGSGSSFDNTNKETHSNNIEDENCDDHNNIEDDDDSDEFIPPNTKRSIAIKKTCYKLQQRQYQTRCNRLTRRQEKLFTNSVNNNNNIIKKNEPVTTKNLKSIIVYNEHNYEEQDLRYNCIQHEEEHIFLIDYGLASKYTDNGIHRPFIMDQRRAHDGTLEFTSRDAHMGAHSRRSDLECLGYNLLFWSQGYLPWKDAAMNQQPEKVHRAKEYLMLNVRQILREIYGEQIPKYLGEFLHLVSQLSYNERPDYERYRRLFEHEYIQLGYTLNDMRLSMDEILRTSVRVRESDMENKTDFFKVTTKTDIAGGVKCIALNNLSVSTPVQEQTLNNRVSPKNLRSKSSKKAPGKTTFSWTEILSQDPDQIARERAEKEFEREEMLYGLHRQQETHHQQRHPLAKKYQGQPTYAIKEILRRLKYSSRTMTEETFVEKHNRQQQQDKLPYSVSKHDWLNVNAVNIDSSNEGVLKTLKKENSTERIIKNSQRNYTLTNNQSSSQNDDNLPYIKSSQLNKKLSKSGRPITLTPLHTSTPIQTSISIKNSKKNAKAGMKNITKITSLKTSAHYKIKPELAITNTSATTSTKTTRHTRRHLIRPVNIMRRYNDDDGNSVSNDITNQYSL